MKSTQMVDEGTQGKVEEPSAADKRSGEGECLLCVGSLEGMVCGGQQ